MGMVMRGPRDVDVPEIFVDWFEQHQIANGVLTCLAVRCHNGIIHPTVRITMPSSYLGRSIEGAMKAADPELMEMIRRHPLHRLMS
ncbi:hypothetical protein JQ628_11460 [Bradyrhizobium lablabi]|uniref:hypothetical protein n=1 Tax=Bradyrhizobium lablabi TaxID=722472 RepID=UPI001BA5E948|nr:hypothetical protein [Bradyrhizobium lablabi]MBR1122133.1 hypothetical protein [Bradyrhizobium lablabi]